MKGHPGDWTIIFIQPAHSILSVSHRVLTPWFLKLQRKWSWTNECHQCVENANLCPQFGTINRRSSGRAEWYGSFNMSFMGIQLETHLLFWWQVHSKTAQVTAITSLCMEHVVRTWGNAVLHSSKSKITLQYCVLVLYTTMPFLLSHFYFPFANLESWIWCNSSQTFPLK